MTDTPRTTNLGSVGVGPEPPDGFNFWHTVYLSIDNHYRVPEGGAVKRDGQRHFDEVSNNLEIAVVGDDQDETTPLIDVPISREDCFRIARLFLDVAMHSSWDDLP